MAHEWIFDVLQDMRSYSHKNGLAALAVQLDETLRVARTEIGPGPKAPSPQDSDDGKD
jgi:hypothetical protein